MLGKEALPCEDEEGQEGEEVPVSGGDEEECCQNGDGGQGTPLEEDEIKPEDEHNSYGSSDNPSDGQQ